MAAGLRVLLAAMWLLSGVAVSSAQGYPNKPVRVVVGFPAGLPDVPTFAEQGVKDQDADTLTGIVAPAGTPKEIVDLLYREIAKIVAQPDVKERLTVLGFKPVANTPDQFGARIRLEMDKWGKVVRDAKLRIE